jgi:hypothetical protein
MEDIICIPRTPVLAYRTAHSQQYDQASMSLKTAQTPTAPTLIFDGHRYPANLTCKSALNQFDRLSSILISGEKSVSFSG